MAAFSASVFAGIGRNGPGGGEKLTVKIDRVKVFTGAKVRYALRRCFGIGGFTGMPVLNAVLTVVVATALDFFHHAWNTTPETQPEM